MRTPRNMRSTNLITVFKTYTKYGSPFVGAYCTTYVGCVLNDVESLVGFPMSTHCGSSRVLPAARYSIKGLGLHPVRWDVLHTLGAYIRCIYWGVAVRSGMGEKIGGWRSGLIT